MITVMYLVSTLKRSGPINVLYNIVKYLDKTKFDVHILTLSKELNDSAFEDFMKLGVKVHTLNMSRVKGILSNYKGINNVFREVNPDIIHSHGIRGDMINADIVKDKISITTMHNFPYNDYPLRYGKIKGNLMAKLHIKKLKNLDVLVACSKSISKNFKDFDLTTHVIQNGIDQNKYKVVSNDEKAKVRQKLNLPLNKKIFISVGHLSKLKDPITLIEAYKKMSIENDILVILGDGELYNECRQLKGNNDSIQLFGRVDNVNEFLQAADYFVSSSTSEGMPNAVLEALSSGLPVCLSNIPPHKEILNIDSGAGELFNVGDSEDLALKLRRLTQKNYVDRSSSAQNIINMELNARVMSNRYSHLYQKLFINHR